MQELNDVYPQGQTTVSKNMLAKMKDHYNSLKSENGFEVQTDRAQIQSEQLDQVLQQLKPNATAGNFRHFIKQSQKTHTGNWKPMKGLIDREDRVAAQQQLQFQYSASSKLISQGVREKPVSSFLDGLRVTSVESRERLPYGQVMSSRG